MPHLPGDRLRQVRRPDARCFRLLRPNDQHSCREPAAPRGQCGRYSVDRDERVCGVLVDSSGRGAVRRSGWFEGDVSLYVLPVINYRWCSS